MVQFYWFLIIIQWVRVYELDTLSKCGTLCVIHVPSPRYATRNNKLAGSNHETKRQDKYQNQTRQDAN